jgi:adenine-specific DNA-methyltransferase
MARILRSVTPPDPFTDAALLSEEMELLRRNYVLPIFGDGEQRWMLKEDVADVAMIRHATAEVGASADRLFPLAPQNVLGLDEHTRVELLDNISHPALGPAVRSLARTQGGAEKNETACRWLPGTTILSTDTAALDSAATQSSRVEAMEHLRAPDLAGATAYMGSKRELASFLVEAVFSETEGKPAVTMLDLMCGSGAAAAAFACYWPTYASDAQQFSVLLARSQGGGMTALEARATVDEVISVAAQHVDTLMGPLASFVEREDELLHAGDHDAAVTELRQFLDVFPRYGMPGTNGWMPTELVDKARTQPTVGPHVLFTSYFANIYFGVRQCVEIDSLRAAINQLDEPYRSWALAALIASVASVATTYGGHFAQPRISNPDQVTEKNIGWLIERRSASVVHEFSARLLNLAAESELTAFPVVGLDGPWEHALETFLHTSNNGSAVVYLDPPYRREEYSRYYHVLETLVRYDYPDMRDRGLAPPKGSHRFASEFFTRSADRREQLLVKIISAIVGGGASCAWSYSDSADGSIKNVIHGVLATSGAKVRSYSASHRHRAHGGRSDKKVTEYLIWFHPEGNM